MTKLICRGNVPEEHENNKGKETGPVFFIVLKMVTVANAFIHGKQKFKEIEYTYKYYLKETSH